MSLKDICSVDWNKLSPEDFQSLEKQMQDDKELLKKTTPRKKRDSTLITIEIKGKKYQVKSIIYDRYKRMKSEKSRMKLIEEILTTHNPIVEL